MSDIKIGFMGVFGSFSEKASRLFAEKQAWGVDCSITYIPLVDAFHVRDALLERRVDFGVVAVKNSTTGIVAETRAAFENLEVRVLDETSLPIHQCLFSLPDVSESKIEAVASHPQALLQTRSTRKKLYGELPEVIMEDTSLSAKLLAKKQIPAHSAVICSMEAGMMHGLKLLRANIEDDPENRTYFNLIQL